MSIVPPRVLIIDDNDDEREMYVEWLRLSGCDIAQARTAADGYKMATEYPPDVVVSDVRLFGGEDGIHLTERLKSNTRTHDVPIVILTGCVFPQDERAAARAGCDLFLSKPCLPEVLSDHVLELVRVRTSAL